MIRPPLVAALLMAGVVPSAGAADPSALYGGGLLFEIQRNGSPVGEHRVDFSPGATPGTVAVAARSTIAVPFLGFTAYRFRYESHSLWRNGALERLDAETDDDGARTRVTARRDGGLIRVDGAAGAYALPAPLFPTDHWNASVLTAPAVLNTITGAANAVTITAEGREDRPTGTGPRPATRYRYAGELQAQVWYDDAGRWVGLRFSARDGSVIEYRCRRCGGTSVAEVIP